MDYEVLNNAINEVVDIVNNYNRDHHYSVGTCEDLVIALTGYYLTFGPEIFFKIMEVLSSLEIHKTTTTMETLDEKAKIRPNVDLNNTYPEMILQMKFKGSEKEFIGAIPHIVYDNQDQINDALNLAHELSHAIEMSTAKVDDETTDTITIRCGLMKIIYDKETGAPFDGDRSGMDELITALIENRILQAYGKLDPEKIQNPLIKEFTAGVQSRGPNSALADSYMYMAAIFKDMIDNDIFFDVVKKHYYETDPEEFTKEFNSIDERLDFQKLIGYAERLKRNNTGAADFLDIANAVQSQLTILNKATNTHPEKSLLLIV